MAKTKPDLEAVAPPDDMSAPARAVFIVAKEKETPPWLVAAVKYARGWTDESAVSDAEYEKATSEVLNIRLS